MEIKNVYKQIENTNLPIMLDVLGPLLNRDVQLDVVAVEETDITDLKSTYPKTPVIVEVGVQGKVSGSTYFVFSQRLAAAVTDLMVMGDGTAEFNEQESLDGIAEASNQVMGALTTFWAEQLSENLAATSSEASLVAWDAFPDDPTKLVRVDYNLNIEDWGESRFTKLMPAALFDLLGAMPDLHAESEFGASSKPGGGGGGRGPTVRPAEFGAFEPSETGGISTDDIKNLDLLMDVSLPVTIELGRTNMLIRDVLEIGPGSVIELQKLSGEPVDLYVNDKKFALGEVVVIDENFGIRITELLQLEDRLKALK
ncbi:flagellar motor switch protein FliN [bacterium]|nr:flagellar motor switch protein FliN [bacterium]